MASFGKTNLELRNLSEKETFSGKSFMIYNDSATRKTRTLGTLPGRTIHCSLDNGAESAMRAAELLEIEGATHHEVKIDSLADLDAVITTLQTSKSYIGGFDTVVFDNLVEITQLLKDRIVTSSRYKADQLKLEDIMDPEARLSAQSSKTMALYNDIQIQTRSLLSKMLSLTVYYNVIVLTNYIEIETGKAIDPGLYPQINGPKSIRPAIGLFDEVYSTDFVDGEFDSKDKINTKFKISSFTSTTTGKRWFNKTRYITELEYLLANEIPADFRLIYKQTGYVLKQNRDKK